VKKNGKSTVSRKVKISIIFCINSINYFSVDNTQL